MFKKIVSGIALTLLLTSILTLAFNIQPVKTDPTTIIVPDDYPTIQEAINVANEGDSVFVRNGTYYEHVVVNKTMSLIGENRETTIIDGNGTDFVVLVRNAINFIISGFTIQGSGYVFFAGIYLFRSNNGTVNNNILKNNDWAGIRLQFSDNNTISGNKITDNYCPIACQWSNRIIIKNNNLINNQFGMDLFHSNSSTIIRNNITENGISILGVRNIVIENTIAYSDRGILFYGLESETCDNKIYHNNFISNVVQVETEDLVSFWDDGYSSGGNYWSDYSGTDDYHGPYQNETGSDSIGDSPYVIDSNNTDYYPLVNPYLFGDVDYDSIVDIADLVRIVKAVPSAYSSPNYNPRADLNKDNVIDIEDLTICVEHIPSHW